MWFRRHNFDNKGSHSIIKYFLLEGLTSKHTNDNVMNIVGNQYSVKKYIGCSFKFILKVGFKESIVNAPLSQFAE
jgi:hypothetical protein